MARDGKKLGLSWDHFFLYLNSSQPGMFQTFAGHFPSLINPAHANRAPLPSLTNPAQVNQMYGQGHRLSALIVKIRVVQR